MIEDIIAYISIDPTQKLVWGIIITLLLMINRKVNLNYIEYKSDSHATVESLSNKEMKQEYKRLRNEKYQELKERYNFLKGIGIHILIALKALIYHNHNK